MLKRLRPTTILAKLGRETPLVAVLRELEERRRVLANVKPLLPNDLAVHCSQAQIDGECLRLFADSPVWAARLRLHSREVLDALAARGLSLKQCQIRVSPPLAPARDTRRGATPDRENRRGSLSLAAASHLRQAAHGALDKDIAACFERIARHHGPQAPD